MIEVNYLEALISVLSRTYTNLQVLGVFTTSNTITTEVVMAYEEISAIVNRSLGVVTLDTSLDNYTLSLRVYNVRVLMYGTTMLHMRVEPARWETQITEPERIAISHMISDNDDIFSPTRLKEDVEILRDTLNRMSVNLGVISDNIESIAKNNKALLPKLNQAIFNIPTINREVFEKTLGTSLDDMLLVIFLASLTRAQVALSDNANNL
uniref:Eukaryotic translation initiation factor 3 subunit F n=2 Tax=Lygus hesperus TaxID=30085 RepID=A0A0A9XAR1_LYGHE